MPPQKTTSTPTPTAPPTYLTNANFDPSKLTINELVSILSKHQVAGIPAKRERKQVYVELFRKEISFKRTRLLKLHQSVEPSDAGVVYMEGHQEIEEATGAAFSQEQQQPELLSEEDEEYLLQESVLPVPAALPFLIAPDEYSPPPQPQPPPPSSSLIPKPTPVKKLIPVVPFVKMASPRSSLQRQLVSTAPLDAASEVAIVVHQMKEAPVAAISTPELLKGKVKSLKSAYEKTIAFKPVASAPPPPPPSEPTATEAAMVIIDSFLDSENQAPLPHLSKPVSTPQKGIREALLSPQRKTRSSLLLDSTTANTVMGSPHRDSDTTLTVMNTNINTTSTPARYSQEDKLYSSAGVGVKEFLASPALKIHPQLSAVLEQAAALSKRKSLSKQLAEEAKIVATPRIEKKAGVFGGEEDVEDEDDDELPMDQTMIDQEETLVMSYTQEEVQEQQQAEMLAFPTSSREDSFLSKTEDVDAADEALCLLEEERDLHSEASSSSSPMATTTLTPSSVSWMIVKSTLKLVFYLTLLYLGFASTFSSTSISNNNQNYCDFGPNVFMDVCIPCPENAACLEGDLTGCRDGFTFGPSTFISTVAPSKLYPVLDSFLPIFITKSSTLCVLEQEDENVSTTTTYSTSWFLSVFASSNRVSSSQISDMTWSQFFENVVDGVMGVMNGVWKFIADSISSIVSVFEKIVSLDVFGSWATKSDVMTSDSTSSSSSSSSFFFSSSSEDASSSSNERGEWTLPPPSNMYTQFQQFLAIQRENLNLLWSRWSPIIKYNMDVYAEKLRPYTEAVTRGVFSEYTSLKSRFESFIDRQYEMISTYYIALQVTETVFEFKKWVGPYALEVLFTSLAIVALAGLWVVDRSRRAADVKHSVGIMVPVIFKLLQTAASKSSTSTAAVPVEKIKEILMPATTYTSTADTSGAALVREEVWQQVHRQIIQSRRVAEKTDKLSSTTWEWIGRKDRFQCVGCSSCEEHQELLENCLDSFEL